jgi:MinD-like ATPase involved in chromosome partitioning or flagellar assembly
VIKIGKVISFVSVKGGVGKTTLSMEISVCLANEFKKRVLLIDGNISAPNVSLYLDLTHKNSLQDVLKGESFQNAVYESYNVDVIPAALNHYDKTDIMKLKRIVEKVKNRYDFIIIDSSPHYSEMIPVVAASDMIFVVTTADEVTLHTSLRAAREAKQKGTPIEGIIINRIKESPYELNCEEVEYISQLPVIGRVKEEKKMIECLFYKKPIIVKNPRGKSAEEIRRISGALCGETEKRNWFLLKFLKGSDKRKEQINREIMRKRFITE